MTPLALIFAHQKLNDDDRYFAEAVPLMHKRLLLEGKAHNSVIDTLFELAYRLQIIGTQIKNQPIYQTGVAAHKALIAACDHAADKSKLTINPSTDQKRAICNALDTLARLAGLMNNRIYHGSRILAEQMMQNMEMIAA